MKPRLVGLAGGEESLVVLAAKGVTPLVILKLDDQRRSLAAVLPRLCEFVGGSRRLILEAWADDALLVARHGREEVGRGLLAGALEAEVLEVGPGFVGLAEEDLPAFVEYNDFVKNLLLHGQTCTEGLRAGRNGQTYIVRILRSLVDGHASSSPHDIRLCPERAAKLQSVCTVQAPGAVVPALQRRVAKGSLGDGNTLPLAATYASNVVVADARVLRVRDAEHGHGDVAEMLGILPPRDALGDRVWTACPRGKVERVAGSQVGEMVVDFSGIDGFAAESGAHLAGADALVVDNGFVAHVEAMSVPGDGLEKGRAT